MHIPSFPSVSNQSDVTEYHYEEIFSVLPYVAYAVSSFALWFNFGKEICNPRNNTRGAYCLTKATLSASAVILFTSGAISGIYGGVTSISCFVIGFFAGRQCAPQRCQGAGLRA